MAVEKELIALRADEKKYLEKKWQNLLGQHQKLIEKKNSEKVIGGGQKCS